MSRLDEGQRRRRIRPTEERLTFARDLSSGLYVMVAEQTSIRWPSPKYRQDPIGYFRDILGVEPWSVQRRVLESVRDNPRTSWKSGHRVSKSNTAAGSGLWFYGSFEDARVIMTAPTAHQIDDILWREAKMMRKRAGKCVGCKREDPDDLRIPRPCPHSAKIDGEMGELARTGLKSVDFREIKGLTAKDVEAVTGTAGKNLFFIFDECSGIDDALFEGFEGNRAGFTSAGSGVVRVLYTGNPTKPKGEFYRSHTTHKEYFFCITTSSEESPNVVERREVIPGLATLEWIEEKKRMWGEHSPLYLIRVKGEFATREDGKIFPVHRIEEAEQRWPKTEPEGRLFIGLDPAGESGTGDEACFCPRRGLKILEFLTFRGLTPEGHVAHLLGVVSKWKVPRETPVVVMDREGSVGAKVWTALHQHLYAETSAGRPATFQLVGVRASDRARRRPDIYDRVRDELTASFDQWLGDGGALPEDAKLAAEMQELEWEQNARGRLKVTHKKELRRELGRSPDRYDSAVLSCWEPLALQEEGLTASGKKAAGLASGDDAFGSPDPYDGGIDPYG